MYLMYLDEPHLSPTAYPEQIAAYLDDGILHYAALAPASDYIGPRLDCPLWVPDNAAYTKHGNKWDGPPAGQHQFDPYYGLPAVNPDHAMPPIPVQGYYPPPGSTAIPPPYVPWWPPTGPHHPHWPPKPPIPPECWITECPPPPPPPEPPMVPLADSLLLLIGALGWFALYVAYKKGRI